jgi:hypothetical protein
MATRYKKFYIEWWRIRRSTIYGLAALVIIASAASFGLWYAVRSNWFSQENIGEMPKDAARILSFEGDVRITRAATRETIIVNKAIWVAAGDTIQTQADGRAVIQMVDGSVYSVRPNSTVIIRSNTSLFGGPNVRVTLDDGQLNVRTEDQPENTKNVVEMQESETSLKAQTDASFRTDAQSNTAEIRITRGSVETKVGDTTTTLAENEYAAVNNGQIAAREQLLLPPKPISPADGAQLVDANGSGVSVQFTWDEQSTLPIMSYSIQVSKSPIFASDSILIDRSSLNQRSFRMAGLVPGTYYWRVKSTSKSGQSSEWNAHYKFTIVKRGASPLIDAVNWNVERVGGNVYLISGQTKPGLLVRSQNNQTFAGPDGSFRLQVSTPLSEVAIELSDDAGNRAGFVLSLKQGRIIRKF